MSKIIAIIELIWFSYSCDKNDGTNTIVESENWKYYLNAYHGLPCSYDVQRTGYKLIGWNTEPDGSGFTAQFGSDGLNFGFQIDESVISM